MTEWQQTTLGEMCDAGGGQIRTGPFGSQLHQSDYSDEGTPVVMPKDIAAGRVDEEGIARINVEHVERLSQHKLAFGDIVYGRRGDIGRKALVTEREVGWLCGTGCLRVTVGKGVDPRFLFYRLGHPDTVTAIQNRAIGATMPNLNTTILREVELTAPPIETQRRIAAILGAYDDLIEVNRRRVAVLEEMARGLFEEWFVRFRFPGHETVPIVDTPDGPLPEGWEYGPFTDVAEVLSGGTPKKNNPEYWGGDIPFFTPRDAPTMAWVSETINNVTMDGVKHCNSRLYDVGTVFITARGTVGKVAMAAVPMAMNQSCYALVGKEYPQSFVFGLTLVARDRLRGMSGGAVFDTIIVDTFNKLKLNIPPRSLALRYEKQSAALLDLSRILSRSITYLAASRDLLLPRLISGQLSVEGAERQLEDAA